MKSTAKYWIEVFQGRAADSPFYFRIRARNGAIVMHSEGYKRAASRNKIVDRLSLVHGFEVRKGLP